MRRYLIRMTKHSLQITRGKNACVLIRINRLILFESLTFIQTLSHVARTHNTFIEIIYNFYTAIFNRTTHRTKFISRLQFLITKLHIYIYLLNKIINII